MRPLFLLMVIASLVLPLRAQDNSVVLPADCSEATVKDVVKNTKTAIDALDATVNSSAAIDAAKVAQSLEAVKSYVGMLKAQCDGLVFTGDKPTVLGPITLSEGIYKLTAKTDKYLIAELTVTDGECGQGSGRRLGTSLFILTEGQAKDGAETVFTSKGCTGLIEVSNVREPWSLAFEKLN